MTIFEFIQANDVVLRAKLTRVDRLLQDARLSIGASDVVLPVLARLALSQYLLEVPERHFNRDVFRDTVKLIEEHGEDVAAPGDLESSNALRSAITTLQRINRRHTHSGSEIYQEHLRDQHLHQNVFEEYSLLAEYCYGTLVSIPAKLMIQKLGVVQKGTSSAKKSILLSQWRQATTYLPPHFHDCYNSKIRNAIVHGGVHVRDWDVEFLDERDSLVLPIQEANDLSANLLDVCNAIVAALCYSSCRNRLEHGDTPFKNVDEGVRLALLFGLNRVA